MTRVNAIARQIQAHDFTVHQPPHPSVCQNCSLLTLCLCDGTLQPSQTSRTARPD